ncbi:hypothetical protein D3C85_1730850 [compost metagenome]
MLKGLKPPEEAEIPNELRLSVAGCPPLKLVNGTPSTTYSGIEPEVVPLNDA